MSLREISIGPVAFEIPNWLDVRDEDGTLVAYPPRTDYVNLRVSVSTIANEDGKPSAGAGERIVRGLAAKQQKELQQDSANVWFTYSEPSTEGSEGSMIKFWQVGLGAHTALVSCFVDSIEGDAATKKRVMDSIVPLIRSFRTAST